MQTSPNNQGKAELKSETSMHAATINQYGHASVIQFKSVERPRCGPEEVTVAVRATSVNPYDWHNMTGTPLLMRMGGGLRAPKSQFLGLDVAGVVVDVGENVSRFTAGDEVFGCAAGAFAEFVTAPETTLVHKPANVSFEEAAAVPVAALTAVQGLRDHGQLKKGQKVLINGASGGVGTYAMQFAKYFGAEVTGVCSGKNAELIRELGADHVINYTVDDFTKSHAEYDLILDNMGNRKMAEYKRCLKPSGCYVAVGAPKSRVLGPLTHMLKAFLAFKFGSQRSAVFMAQQTLSDLEFFAELMETGALRSMIDKAYTFNNLAAAIDHLETGHARGKIVVSIP